MIDGVLGMERACVELSSRLLIAGCWTSGVLCLNVPIVVVIAAADLLILVEG